MPAVTSAKALNNMIPYATSDELDWLYEVDATVAVMLGAGPGVMAMSFLEGHPEGTIVIVDHGSLEYVTKHLVAAGLHNFACVECDSADAAQMYMGNVVDLLIVDADHSYEGVKRDIEAWLPKVAPRGWMFFHDYNADGTYFAGNERYFGVKLAVDEYGAQGTRIGTALVVRKCDFRKI